MSGFLNSSLNSSDPNLLDNTGRPFHAPFSAQSGAPSPAFHHSGTAQGFHNMQGNFNIPNMSGTLASRNSSMNNMPAGGVQQATGNLSGGRFASNNLPVGLSQISHGGSHGHSSVTNRGGVSVVGNPGYNSSLNSVGGSIPGILQTSAAIGSRNAVGGVGVSPMLGNAGSRITSSAGSIVGSGNIGRNLSSGGGISVPGLGSRLNMSANSGSGNLSVQGQNRLVTSMLQQGNPQVVSMLGNPYPSSGGSLSHNHGQSVNNMSSMGVLNASGGSLSHNHGQSVNNMSSMGVLNDVNSNESSPFDITDFPQLTSQPDSAGGPQGQLGSMRKQGLGAGSIVHQNREFSIQNEDFPALPGFKGGSADYGLDAHQKEQLHDNMSMMQSQHFSIGRSAGFNLGGPYTPNRPQQQQQQQPHMPSVSSGGVSFPAVNNQELSQMHASDMFPSHSMYHLQNLQSGGAASGIGSRPMNPPNTLSGMNSYDQHMQQQYQRQQNLPQYRPQQMPPSIDHSFRDQGVNKSMQMQQGSAPDRFGIPGLMNVLTMKDPELASLALGIDLTTLGLNLNSSDKLYKTFSSPWSDEPVKGDPEFVVPQCLNARPPPPLHPTLFRKFKRGTLFYIFYSMPKDEAQLYAADELMRRGWLYHRELRMWLKRAKNMDPLATHPTYERGTFMCFDRNTWQKLPRANFVLHYDALEKPNFLQQQQQHQPQLHQQQHQPQLHQQQLQQH